MKLTLQYRLFLAILAATGVVAISMFLILQWSMDRGFLRFINNLEQERLERLAEDLGEAYSGSGGWQFLAADSAWHRLLAGSLPREKGPPPPRVATPGPVRMREIPPGPPGEHPPYRYARQFGMRVVLLDTSRNRLRGQDYPAGEQIVFLPVRSGGEVVGHLGLLPRKRLTDSVQLRFLKQQKLGMGLVALIMFVVSAGIALPLANRLLRPIRALAEATHLLAIGLFDTRVDARRRDELGQLGRDFNFLAQALQRNEQDRRQWVADISHELRTPLSVLRGEIEALQDGIRQPTPAALQSLHGEVLQLGRLVDDLYQLSLTDLGALSYRKEEIDLARELTTAVDAFRTEFARKGLALHLGAVDSCPLLADVKRLRQLFDNLLNNSLAYTDPGGELDIRLEQRGDEAIVDFRDSSPGVGEGDLEKLFDRLYRVESSRNRSTGGAGLGLAICRNIVEAHGGSIDAHPSHLGGVWIRIRLPLEEVGS